jgi:hypothetical protein
MGGANKFGKKMFIMSNPEPISNRTLPISLARDRLGSSFLTAIFLYFTICC